ncbi:MAG TPA: DUF1192 domain-containing protein [Methylocella sp.]|nr:DUF1192 domain-containing protein [Methylocella sp.]
MPADDDEFPNSKRPTAPVYEIGQPLDDLSVEEIGDYIRVLESEISRLADARNRKQSSLSAAASIFK